MAGVVFDPGNNLPGPPINLPSLPARPVVPVAASPVAPAADPWAAFPDAKPAGAPAAVAASPAPVQASAAASRAAVPAVAAASADPWAAFPDASGQPQEQIGGGNALLRGFTNPFGISDEIGGAIQGGVDWAGFVPEGSQGTFSGGYDRFTKRARQLDAESADQHPYLYGGGQLASGIAITAPLAIAGTPVYSATAAKALGLGGDTLLGRMGAGMASGAGIGALTGYASGEGGVDNRLASAGGGALVGGGFGAGAPVVGALVGKAVGGALRAGEAIKGAVTGDTPWRQAASLLGHGGEEPVTVAVNPYIIAAKKLAGMVGADNVTPEMAGAAHPQAMMAELGPNLEEMAGGIAARPGEGQPLIKSATASAVSQGQQGVRDAIDTVLGRRSNVPQTLEDLIDQRAAQSAPLYEKSLSRSVVWSRRLQQFLDDPISKPGLALGAKIQRLEALAENKPFNPTEIALDANGALLHGATPNMRTLNVLKKGLDAMVEDSKDPITGRLSEQGRAIYKVLKSYRDILDKMNPEYAVARKAWEGPTKISNAMRSGQKVFDRSESPDQLRMDLAEMNDSERAGFVMGARQQVAQIMGTARNDATAAVGKFRQEWNQEKLRMLVGNDQANKMLVSLERMQKISNFNTDVIHNSKTAARTAAQKALEDASFLRHTLGTARLAFAVNGFKGVRNIAMTHAVEGLLASHDEARNEQVAAIIARGLIKTGPEKVALIKALMSGVRRMDDIDRQSSGAAALVRALTATAVPPAAVVARRQATQ